MIGLMDCNNFFVSCERLFRPDLLGKPVAVLSSNDGCIVARSKEVKDLGIPMGVPLFEVRDVVEKHSVVLFSSNFALYRDISRRVMHALQEEFDDVAVYSIDEAFFVVPEGCTEEDIALIRARVIQKTGIPVSFGVAPTKTVAKIANQEAKKGSGTVWLTLNQFRERCSTVPCGSVWGIGRQMAAKLEVFGIHTVSHFLEKGLGFARSEFGVHGERLFLELTGIEAAGHTEDVSPNASIMSTQSFGKRIHSKDVIFAALSHHIGHIAEKLRARNLATRSITIICAPGRYGNYVLRKGSATMEFGEPTNDTVLLLEYARRLLDEIHDAEVPYKRAGAIVSGLLPIEYVSESLFETTEKSARESVFAVVDILNKRFGKETIHPGTLHRGEEWSSRTELRSGAFTTRWTEIPHVKAI